MLEEYEYYAKEEQKVLKISIFFTGLLCIVGLTVGTMAKATSIIFDSFYAGVDCFFRKIVSNPTRFSLLPIECLNEGIAG